MTEENTQLPERQPIAANRHGVVLKSVTEMLRVGECAFRVGLVKSADEGFIKIQAGAELGITPMKALQSIYIVHGRTQVWGDMPLALVRRSGLMEYIEERLEGEGDQMVAYCKTKRKDSPSAIEEAYSVDDAKEAGLWGKVGTWTTNRKRMLKYRARSFNLRDNFPEALEGITIQEEYEGVEMPTEVATPSVPKREDRKQVENVAVSGTKDTLNKLFDTFMEKFLAKIEDWGCKLEMAVDHDLILKATDYFARSMLGTPDTDYHDFANYTIENLSKLIKALESPLPVCVTEILPDPLGFHDEDPKPEPEPEAPSQPPVDVKPEPEPEKYVGFKCNKCCRNFDEPLQAEGKDPQCPRCLSMNIEKVGGK